MSFSTTPPLPYFFFGGDGLGRSAFGCFIKSNNHILRIVKYLCWTAIKKSIKTNEKENEMKSGKIVKKKFASFGNKFVVTAPVNGKLHCFCSLCCCCYCCCCCSRTFFDGSTTLSTEQTARASETARKTLKKQLPIADWQKKETQKENATTTDKCK